MLLAALEPSLYKISFINTLIKYIQTFFYTLKTSFIQKIRLYHLPLNTHIVQKLVYQLEKKFKGKQVPSISPTSAVVITSEGILTVIPLTNSYSLVLVVTTNWIRRLADGLLNTVFKKSYIEHKSSNVIEYFDQNYWGLEKLF